MRVNARFWLLLALFVVVVGVIGLVFLSAVPQTFLGGSFTSVASCSAYVRDYWCTEGYACKSCYLSNGFYSSDCYLSGSEKDSLIASGKDVCKTSVVSHNGYWCFDNDVYYFDSAGVREEKKTECGSAGCTSIYTGASTKVGCNVVSAPIGKVCIPNTDYLCNNYYLLNGEYFCAVDDKTFCPNGCVNGACKSSSCSNDCNDAGYVECQGTGGFRKCGNYDNDPCLEWQSYGCTADKVCSGGSCVVGTVPPITTPSSCSVSSVCLTDFSYRITLGDCSTNDVSCDDSEECTNGACKKVPVTPSPITGTPVLELCTDVYCPDGCDVSGNYNTGGSCDSGRCVYQNVVVNDALCVRNDTNLVEPPISTGSSFIDKWGMLIGGALLAILMVLLFTVGKKVRK